MPSACAKVLQDFTLTIRDTWSDGIGEYDWLIDTDHVALKKGWVLEINEVPRRAEGKDATDFHYSNPEGEEGGFSPEYFHFEDFEELAQKGYIELSDVTRKTKLIRRTNSTTPPDRSVGGVFALLGKRCQAPTFIYSRSLNSSAILEYST